MSDLIIKNLHVSIEGTLILKGLNLTVKQGEIHAIMGPNGTGKSTLSYTVMGHPKYEVVEGDILVDGDSILEMPTDERSRLGLFIRIPKVIEIQNGPIGDGILFRRALFE